MGRFLNIVFSVFLIFGKGSLVWSIAAQDPFIKLYDQLRGTDDVKANRDQLLAINQNGSQISNNSDNNGSRVFTPRCLHVMKIDQRHLSPTANDPCARVLNIHYIETQPYTGDDFRKLINETFEACCATLERVNYTKTTNIRGKAHFIYPVLSERNTKLAYGYSFIPLIDPPGAFFVTKTQGLHLPTLILQCLRLWPFLALCIVMSAIAGFLAWICETRGNKDEFHREFFRGWFDGTWWSFISMTTVGYGDKVPRSIPGRILSILWILAGIITFNILAGELTTVILKAQTVKEETVADKKVGTLNRLYEQSLVATNGGILIRTSVEDADEMKQFDELIYHLKVGTIDGMVLDKYTYRTLKTLLQQRALSYTNGNSLPPIQKGLMDFFLTETTVSSVPHIGEEVSYGLLVRDTFRYDYFASTLESQRLAFKSNIALRFHHSAVSVSEGSGNSFHLDVLFNETWVMCLPIIFIACFGCAFQCYYRKRNRKKSVEKQQSLMSA